MDSRIGRSGDGENLKLGILECAYQQAGGAEQSEKKIGAAFGIGL